MKLLRYRQMAAAALWRRIEIENVSNSQSQVENYSLALEDYSSGYVCVWPDLKPIIQSACDWTKWQRYSTILECESNFLMNASHISLAYLIDALTLRVAAQSRSQNNKNYDENDNWV